MGLCKRNNPLNSYHYALLSHKRKHKKPTVSIGTAYYMICISTSVNESNTTYINFYICLKPNPISLAAFDHAITPLMYNSKGNERTQL